MGKTKTAFVGEKLEDKKKPSFAKKASKGKKVHISGLKGGQRIVALEADLPPEEEKTQTLAPKKVKTRSPRGKKYLDSKAKVRKDYFYPLEEAIKLVKETSYSNFEGRVELNLTLKSKSLQTKRQEFKLVLPHKFGQQKKVEIASKETVEKLAKGVIDFDVLLATPDMMPLLVPFAKILGPKGLMPNPKNDTLISNIKKAKEFSPNTLTLKSEKEAPLIHTVVGTMSQEESEILGNTQAIFSVIGEGQILKAFLKATMGPSIKLKLT